jgi:hypothetical protein
MNSLDLQCGSHVVGTYVHRPDVPAQVSPRPFFHPLTTLAGAAVTAFMPPDHLHHLGVGLAVPDVAGHNFWGGRTFVRGQGPTALDNHGVQRHTRWTRRAPDGFAEELSWTADGCVLLSEQRTVDIRALSSAAWELDVAFTFTNATGSPLRIGSPATNGRPGAGYGGFFWRAPKESRPPRVFSARADGEDAVHGSRAAWLAMTGGDWTLVFSGADPWFVRAREYPGVGSALAWRRPLTLPAGGAVVRRVVTAVADGRLSREEAAALARRPDAEAPP